MCGRLDDTGGFCLISNISATRQVPVNGCSLEHLGQNRRRVPNSYATLQLWIDAIFQFTENNPELLLHRSIKCYAIFQYNLFFSVKNNSVYNKNKIV